MAYLNMIPTIQLCIQLFTLLTVTLTCHPGTISTFLQTFIQTMSHLEDWAQSTTPTHPLIYLCIHLSNSVLSYPSSIASTPKQHSSISLPSQPAVRNLQFIFRPFIWAVTSRCNPSIYPFIYKCMYSPPPPSSFPLFSSMGLQAPIISVEVVPTSIRLAQPPTLALDVIRWSITGITRHIATCFTCKYIYLL